ncbi:MAG: bifunctional hydroxymethylpyrimidine kinase/phosphomethylpyrimidine kinase [Euryarchaeota archaeon]|nr:bifunctional hydroxymethylpyrimidine kinase/phosphomethylpyrimidine kinase [Euryarchaeota archaeon]
MRTVLAIGGLDPTGGAGITADALHLADLGIHCLPVATASTVQTLDAFTGMEAVGAPTFGAAIEAAFTTGPPRVVKTGLFAGPEQVGIVARALEQLRAAGHGFHLVVDPVGTPSAAGPNAEDPRDAVVAAIAEHLVPYATCITPNLDELSTLTGEEVATVEEAEAAARTLLERGCRSVLVTGVPDGDGRVLDLFLSDGTEVRHPHPRDALEVHGTGCALTSRLAAYLALDVDVSRAVTLAVGDLERLRRTAVPVRGHRLSALHAFPLASDGDAPEPARHLEAILPDLVATLPSGWVAECGANVAYAPRGAERESEVAALVGRIRIMDGRVHAPMAARLGASGHVARVALAAATATRRSACALNLRHLPEVFRAAEQAGLKVGSFLRGDEPEEARSSVEWGTRTVMDHAPVDLVADDGGPGKEPMVRLIAEDPRALLDRLDRLVRAAARTETLTIDA